jgi:hypothetical protein
MIVFLVASPWNACGAAQFIQTTPDGCFALQFGQVAGKTPSQVMRLLSEAEKRFFTITGFVPTDYPPVIVSLNAQAAHLHGAPVLRVDALEGGLPRIQVDLTGWQAGGVLDSENRLLVEGLLLREFYAGKAPSVGERIPSFPQWITHGLARLCLEDHAKTVILASYLHGGTPPEIDAFLLERAPGNESLLLLENYNERASCLLRAGLLRNGGAPFRKWIGHHDMGVDGFLKFKFPSGWDKHGVERDWLLMMAASSSDNNATTGVRPSLETIRDYDRITRGLLDDQVVFLKNLKDAGWEFRSRELTSRLMALRLQGNPLISPLIDGTVIFLQSAKRLSPKKLTDQLGKLTLLRTVLFERAKAIDAYLDWYEAAKVPLPSGLYDSLLHAPDMPTRKGPVGRHLDSVEERGW